MVNQWLSHVKEFRAQNPDMSYKEVLTHAADTYKKKINGTGVGGSRDGVPRMEHPLTEEERKEHFRLSAINAEQNAIIEKARLAKESEKQRKAEISREVDIMNSLSPAEQIRRRRLKTYESIDINNVAAVRIKRKPR